MLHISTLEHKHVKSQKQHLRILWGRGSRCRGSRADRWGRGPRGEENKYPKIEGWEMELFHSLLYKQMLVKIIFSLDLKLLLFSYIQ